MTHTDAKQKTLAMWFSHLRWLKRRQLPRVFDDPIIQARHDAAVRDEIDQTEREIEEMMNDEKPDVYLGGRLERTGSLEDC